MGTVAAESGQRAGAMSPLLRAAVVLMIAALLCYSIGVWSERLAGRLKPWHAVFFWLGFVCDLTGTELMRRMVGGWHFSFHNFTGATALLLMLGHAIWASVVLTRHDERMLVTFHRVSVVVWAIWLVPFISGVVIGQTAAR